MFVEVVDLNPKTTRFSSLKISRFALAVLAVGLLLVGVLLPVGEPAEATAGINKTINYQGRLLTNTGAVVADGNYNLRFKVYQDGAGTAANNGGTGLEWTEKWENQNGGGQGVVVKNGYFSVTLGTYCAFSGGSCQGNTNTAVDWNQDTLWLSMDVGGTTAGSPTYNGELLPMRRMSSAVYALQADNANSLGGVLASGYAQLAGTQTFTGTNTFQPTTNIPSVVIKQSSVGSPTADIFNLQTANGSTILQATGPAANESAVTLQSLGATRALTVTSQAAATWSTVAGVLTVQGGGGITVKSAASAAGNTGDTLVSTGDQTGTSLSTGSVTLKSGNASGGTNSSSGAVVIDSGTKSGSGTTGAITIGGTNASAITLGNTSSNILTTVNGTALFKPTSGNDSTTAFRIQNAASTTTVLNADTTNSRVGIGTASPANLLSVSPVTYSVGTASQTASATVVGSGTSWIADMVGSEFIFANGNKYTITAYTDSTHMTLSASATNGSQAYGIYTPALQVTSTGKVGIGTLTPTANLDIRTMTDTTTALRVVNSGNGTVFAVDTVNNLLRGSGTGSNISLTSGTGAFQIGADNTANLALDDNEIMARSNGSSSTLYVQKLGGGLQVQANNTVFKNASDNASSLQVQNSLGTPIFTVGTTNNTAANTAWSALSLTPTNAQATTAVSGGTIAGFDIQFTQNPTVAGNTETVANLNVKQIDTSVTDNTVSSILNLANNDTATGNQVTVTDGIKITGANITNGINLSGTFGTNLITSTNFTVAQGGAITAGSYQGTAVGVAYGGTGLTSTTAYELLAGGTTTTGAFQSIGAGPAGYVLQSNGPGALPNWVGGAGCSTCVAQVPTTTAQNTVTPTVNSVVGLTVNATSGTAAQAMIVNQAAAYAGASFEVNHTNTSGTIDNGLLVNRNGTGGTTTSGINITRTAGTLTNGLSFSGTIGTDINRTTGTLKLQGGGGVNIIAGTTNAVLIDSAGSGSVLLGSNNATTIVVGNSATTAFITVGQSTNTNEIDIGNATMTAGQTQTINIGTSATSTGNDVITVGSTNDGSTLNLQAGTGNVNLLTNASTAGVIAKSNTNSATAFQVQDSSSAALLTADTVNTKVTVNGDLQIGKRTDSGGTTSDWALASGSAGSPCASAATSVDTIKASVVYNGSLYVGTSEADKAEVCRYDGGTTFTRMNSAAGTFGSNSNTDTVNAMTVYNGYLYITTTGGAAGTGVDSGKASVYRWDGSTTFTLINTTQGTLDAGDISAINAFPSMVVLKGALLVGTSKLDVAQIYVYHGAAAGTANFKTLNATSGTFDSSSALDTVASMVVYNGVLFFSTTDYPAANNRATLIAWEGDYSGFGNFSQMSTTLGDIDGSGALYDEITNLTVYNGGLYVAGVTATTNTARIFQIYRESGLTYGEQAINAVGTFGSQTTVDFVRSMAVYNGSLYVGVEDSNGGSVYRYNDNQTFTLTNSGVGTFTSTTNIDAVTTMTPFNDKLFIGTSESNGAEVYNYSRAEGQSRSLLFNASSDNAGSTEQSGFPNQGSIFFAAEIQGINNMGSTGSFIFSNSISTSSGAYDVAEDYPTRDDTLKPGDLVSIDPNEVGFVKKASGPYDPGLVGVYSEKPALRLSQKDVTINGGRAIPVALAGRVPVNVTGDVLPGDPLTSSSTPGVAMKATGSGRIVGMAMGPHSGTEIGTVTAFVNPNYYSGNTDLQSSGAMGDAVVTGALTTKDLVVTDKATIKTLLVTGEATVGSLTVTGTVTTKSLVATDSVATKDLIVSGSADLTDVTVSGHITTKGDKPVVSAEPGAGKDTQVSVDGNDVSGTITVKAGRDGAVGNLVKVTFAKPYGKAPHVVISPNGSKAAELQAFLGGYSTTEFYVGSNGLPAEGQEYKFEYFVTQGE